MALESLEERRARVKRDAEQEARNAEAFKQERASLDRLRGLAGGEPAENTAGAGPAENKAGGGGGAGSPLTFASDAAAQLAAEHNLGPAAFGSAKPSGRNGFTVADVRALVLGGDA
jgi:hypothetical protein